MIPLLIQLRLTSLISSKVIEPFISCLFANTSNVAPDNLYVVSLTDFGEVFRAYLFSE